MPSSHNSFGYAYFEWEKFVGEPQTFVFEVFRRQANSQPEYRPHIVASATLTLSGKRNVGEPDVSECGVL
jgi:hypothetical protein